MVQSPSRMMMVMMTVLEDPLAVVSLAMAPLVISLLLGLLDPLDLPVRDLQHTRMNIH